MHILGIISSVNASCSGQVDTMVRMVETSYDFKKEDTGAPQRRERYLLSSVYLIYVFMLRWLHLVQFDKQWYTINLDCDFHHDCDFH